MKKGSANTHTIFITIFLVPILAFSLTSIGIFKGNTVIGIDVYATKSEGSSRGGTSTGSNSDTGGKNGGGPRDSSSSSDTKSSVDSTNYEDNSTNKKND